MLDAEVHKLMLQLEDLNRRYITQVLLPAPLPCLATAPNKTLQLQQEVLRMSPT